MWYLIVSIPDLCLLLVISILLFPCGDILNKLRSLRKPNNLCILFSCPEGILGSGKEQNSGV